MAGGRLNVCGITAQPGERTRGHIVAGYYPDGSELHIPVILVNGAQPGPTLWLSAGMHAPEVPGIEVIRRITREVVDPAHLRGAIMALPVLNPYGFHQGVMNTPQDEYNINRVFPGDPRGLTSHRLAHTIVESFLPHADAIIDLHANPLPAMQFTVLYPSPALERSRAMAEAFGLTTIESRVASEEKHRTGTLLSATDKPGITVELVSWRRVTDEGVAAGVRGTLNVMRHLGMLDGEIEPQTVPCLPKGRPYSRFEITAARGGLIEIGKDVGEAVRQGEIIARLRDPYGDVVEEVRPHRDGWLLAWPWILSQAHPTGGVLAFVAFELA